MIGDRDAQPPSADEIQTEEGWGGDRPDIARWAIRQGLLLAAFWVLLSGHYTPLLLTLGAASVLLVCWLTYRAGLPEPRQSAFRFARRLPLYVLWLEKEVLLAAFQVVRRAWSPKIHLDPQIGLTPATRMSALAETTYANSITLTPGSLSIHLADDDIEVHSLDRAGIDALHEGRMLGLIRRLENPDSRAREIEAEDREQLRRIGDDIDRPHTGDTGPDSGSGNGQPDRGEGTT
jgi:multicomponent Na+:H+ antiporter subunit E